MSGEISIHNSAREVSQKPELIEKLGISQFELVQDGRVLPFCRKEVCPELPGKPILTVYLHGMGSIGHDNFLQVRIPAERMIRFCEKHKIKTVILFPQCEKDFYWVDISWNQTSHSIPEKPSVYMSMALSLLEKELAETGADKLYGLGGSMGGYGIWDMACRSPRPFDSLAVMCGGADSAQAYRFRNTRVFMIHGAKDGAVPVCRSRDMYAALREAGCGAVKYEELPETEHNAWDPFFDSEKNMGFFFGLKAASAG